LRRRHHDDAIQRDALHHRERGIGGAGGQVDNQIVEVAPDDVAPELLDGAADEGATPDDGLVGVRQQQVDGHQLDAPLGLHRQDAQWAADGALLAVEQHLGNAGPGDVGIEHAHAIPAAPEHHGEEGGN